MLDLALFSSTVFSASTISAVPNDVALYVILFMLPFHLLEGRSLTSAQAGLNLTAQPIAMALAAPLSGTLSDRIGSRLPAMVGMMILAAGVSALLRKNA